MTIFSKEHNSIINQVKATWDIVFPYSLLDISYGALDKNTIYCKGFLAQDRHEFNNGISHNDPLNYMFSIDLNTLKYIEHNLYLYVKPKEKYLAYSSEKLRKQGYKTLTIDKLEKRFNKIKEFVTLHKDNIKNTPFNIDDKI